MMVISSSSRVASGIKEGAGEGEEYYEEESASFVFHTSHDPGTGRDDSFLYLKMSKKKARQFLELPDRKNEDSIYFL